MVNLVKLTRCALGEPLVRISLFSAVSGLLLLLMAIGMPQQASAAGKFDGEWKGKLFCAKDNIAGKTSDQGMIIGSQITSSVALLISKNRVFSQTGFASSSSNKFTGEISASKNNIIINSTHPKAGRLSIEGKFLDVDGERMIKFEGVHGADADEANFCEFYLTWSGEFKGQIISSKVKRSPAQRTNSKLVPKPTIATVSASQSAGSIGKFDGEWKGKLSCFEMEQADGPQFEPSPKDETEVLLEVSLAGKC
jgi:hypothetical protein